MFLHNTKQHEAMPTAFVAIKAIEKQKQEMHCNQNEIDLKTNRYRNKKGFKIKKLNEISSKIYNNSPPCCLLRLNCSRDANFPAFFPFLVKTRRHRSADWRELGKYISSLPFTVAVARSDLLVGAGGGRALISTKFWSHKHRVQRSFVWINELII